MFLNEYINMHLTLLMETFYAAVFQAKFFYRSPQKDEVDIILDSEEKIIPVEILVDWQ